MIKDKKQKIDVSVLNKIAEKNMIKLIKKVDESFKNKVFSIAKKIIYKASVKVVFISGPSAAGKTTTSKMLKDALKFYGIDAITVSLDDFFLNEDESPKNEKGEPDIESPNNIDIPYFKNVLDELLIRKTADFPVYDFKNWKRTDKTKKIVLKPKTMIIIEGIHALNPILFDEIINKNSKKIYLSTNTNYSFKNKIVLTTSQTRLIRRMLRDSISRNITFAKTQSLWENINIGADKYVKPFKKDANFFINTSHAYELFVYKKYAYNKLKKLKCDNDIQMILNALSLVQFELDEKMISKHSLINEFLGNE